MIEKWKNGDLLDDHGKGAAVERLSASLEGLLKVPVEVTRLAPIPAGTSEQGLL
jgi:quinol monooxygenase YgiN